MANKKVNVVFRNGDFFVVPPRVTLKSRGTGDGDELTLENQTDEDVIWSLDDPAPFGAPIREIVTSGQLSAPKSARTAGEFAYQVLMTKSGKKARGNSDPVIIIEN